MFNSMRKLPCENHANYGQRNEIKCHLIYAKLFLNTIINGSTQTSLIFFRGEVAVTQARPKVRLQEL